MLTMQRFYTRLFHGLEIYNPDLAHLVQLTQVSPAQMQVLKTGLSWNEWPTITE